MIVMIDNKPNKQKYHTKIFKYNKMKGKSCLYMKISLYARDEYGFLYLNGTKSIRNAHTQEAHCYDDIGTKAKSHHQVVVRKSFRHSNNYIFSVAIMKCNPNRKHTNLPAG